jgi:NADH:ubiquinone oxidoreductase subunit F (NADH-binding)
MRDLCDCHKSARLQLRERQALNRENEHMVGVQGCCSTFICDNGLLFVHQTAGCYLQHTERACVPSAEGTSQQPACRAPLKPHARMAQLSRFALVMAT